MARTPSNMLALGTIAPDFTLYNPLTEGFDTLDDLQGKKGTFIMFICNHCPFVKHLNPKISELAKEFQPLGIHFIAINSNDIINYPEDAPDAMKVVAREEEYTFPYLFDETQQTALNYEAACTPDFFLFDADLSLVYRGQLDDSRPGNSHPVTGADAIEAFTRLLNNQEQEAIQKPSIGCNIKWKEENL